MEMPQVSVSDAMAPTTRGAHCGHKVNVHNLAEVEVVAVVPATVVHVLPQQLYGGLCTILLDLLIRRYKCGHVKECDHLGVSCTAAWVTMDRTAFDRYLV